MKKIFSLQLCVWLFLTILFSQCTKVDLEEGVRKQLFFGIIILQ